MGPQRVFQAALAVVGAIIATTSHAAPQAPPALGTAPHSERIAVINLDPPREAGSRDESARKLEAAIAAAGFEPVTGNGVEDALAGRDVDRDALELSAAIATAQRAYGELRCNEAMPAARQAIGVAAARQAAGLAVPELGRAWIYVLLCADHDGQLDAALTAASRLRTLVAHRPDEVPASVWAKYPVIDTAADLELVPLDVVADEPGAAIWIDFQRAGISPLHTTLPAGDHVIAAALGTRRGWAAGIAIKSQASVKVPLFEAAGTWSELARRVAAWHGQLPPPAELGTVMAKVNARVALIRTGNTVTAWGRLGLAEPPHVLGTNTSASGPITDVERVLGVVADQIHTWSDHAPDPDQPLLTDSDGPGRSRRDDGERPTRWWVYAAIGAAVVVGGAVLLGQELATDHQQIQLHAP